MSESVEITIQNFTAQKVEILVLDNLTNKISNKYLSKPREYNDIRKSINDIGSYIVLPKNMLQNITLIFRVNDFDETYNFSEIDGNKVIITLYLDNTSNNIKSNNTQECEILIYENVAIGLKKNKYIKQNNLNDGNTFVSICLLIIAIVLLIVLGVLISYLIIYFINNF